MEAVADDLCHLVVNLHLFIQVQNRHYQRERLRLEYFFVFDPVPREKAKHHPPAFAVFAIPHAPIVGAHRGPFAQFFHLVEFVKIARILVPLAAPVRRISASA